jgi:hypothetical protein
MKRLHINQNSNPSEINVEQDANPAENKTAVKSKLTSESSSVFPILVSLMLIILIVAFTVSVFKAEARLFSSVMDHLILNLFLNLIVIISIIWLLIMLGDCFGLNSGRAYLCLKWLLFFVYYPLGRLLQFILSQMLKHPVLTKEQFQNSFIAMQNRLLTAVQKQLKIRNILLLLPHCLQFHECKIRITRGINDCADCGECDICHLKDLGKKYNIKIGIANGGTLARKLVHDTQPDFIIAVACHRDLSDGIRESWRYPVFAILNDRPYGPCFDTRVDVDTVEEIINELKNTEYTK